MEQYQKKKKKMKKQKKKQKRRRKKLDGVCHLLATPHLNHHLLVATRTLMS